MAKFGGLEDNWGLQAVVRGSTSALWNAEDAFSAGSDSCYGVFDLQNDDHGLVFGFPDNLFQNAAALTDELEELYKPFYPVSDSSSPALDVPSSISVPPNERKEANEEVVLQKQSADDNSTATAQTPKYKRRKNQPKKVVVQAATEGLSSDMWAWRKYGQKPIKGSPYPRSYYKCSSTKGCLARKQVEQSCTNPSVLIITYTAEHNHSQPTRKNALAGTTRQKFPPQNVMAVTKNKAAETKENSSTTTCSPSSCCSIKQEINEEINSSDIQLGNEFFAGLEDLDGLISELAGGQQQYYSNMFPMNFYSQ